MVDYRKMPNGLSIVHSLVDKHGGVISVNNLDSGCEFVLSFPRLPSTPAPA